MPAFQPAGDRLYYPGAAKRVAPAMYSADSLTETPPTSLLYAFAVGDFAFPVNDPWPHVEMTLLTFHPNCATVSVYRTVGARRMLVRGTRRISAGSGGLNVIDWEAPFGVDCTYRAAQYDVNGTFLGWTTATTTRVEFEGTVLHNPLDPFGAVVIQPARGWAGKISRPQDADVVWPDGRGVATAVTGQRKAPVDVPLPFYVFTDEDSDRVNDIFGDPYSEASGPSIVCIRSGASQNDRLPRPFFALISDADAIPVNQHAGGHTTRWECTGTETEPPVVALVSAALTYDDLDATYPTYSEMDAAFATYSERDRAYRLAGAATSGNPPSGDNGQSGPIP